MSTAAAQAAVDLHSVRARKARLGRLIGRVGYGVLVTIGLAGVVAAASLGLDKQAHLGYFCAALGGLMAALALWYKRDLTVLPPNGSDLDNRLSVDVLRRLKPGAALSPRTVFDSLKDHWQALFLSNHLLLSGGVLGDQLSDRPEDLAPALQIAARLADQQQAQTIELGFVVAGLLLSSPAIHELLLRLQLQPADVENLANWLGRIVAVTRRRKQRFGGVGRDWSFGFTPLLNHYGENVSLAIAHYGAHFGWLAGSGDVKAIEAAFDNHASGVAVIGPDGIGKTSHVYALAQRLIEGDTSKALAYHQIISLKASLILGSARGPGDLERIMISLANEAVHAGHVILFFDDAQLFFGNGNGAFDASQILLPIVQSRAVPVIFAFGPNDFQRLRSTSSALAGLLTPVVLPEPPQADVMRVLEDTATGLEHRHNVVIAYEALREAYRLSGRYEQDEAYPGKAIKLLEQAITHADHSVVTALSVQQAIEQTRGVKVSTANAAETDTLLNLEAMIHQRMINQSQAVSVVANALRRARAGVANPRRPIGSFLFLGPTGVGKTELAKAIAATYFGDEQAMVRLDMSEYQQPDDVQRLLSSGQTDASSLIMSVRQQPFSVVLLDEIEKAHPNVLNLLLQLLDEGKLTDTTGRSVSFKDTVIIATSNAGATLIRERIAAGQTLEDFKGQFTDQLISSGQFKPELLNRFDEIVLFRPLQADELAQVVRLMLVSINQTLANQNISIELTDAAVAKIVEQGNDPRLGARPMRRTLQRAVEDTIAQKILRGEAKPGDHVSLDVDDLHFS